MAVSSRYIYAASFLPKIPGYMLAPLSGLTVVVAGLQPIGTARRGLPYNNQLITNASGIGEGVVPGGNFTIRTTGSDFNFSRMIGFRQGMITFLNLTVIPFEGNVSAIFVLNQDTLAGIQPTATIYATVKGDPMLATLTYTELVGFGPGLVHRVTVPARMLTIDLTVLGTYHSPEGTVVALKPRTAYSVMPSSDLSLIQFRSNSTVTYVAG
jgi:hypothetical protein